jgi:hypothetical protein
MLAQNKSQIGMDLESLRLPSCASFEVAWSACCRLLQFRPHRLALTWHVQFGEYIECGSYLRLEPIG